MSLDEWFLFVGICSAASMTPGPAILAVIAQSINLGTRRTIPVMLGILSGLSLLALLAILGLEALLQSSPTIFAMLRILGAGYLFYLGVRILLSSTAANKDLIKVTGAKPAKQFMYGVTVSLVNPKAIVFFSALFIQFIDVSSGFLIQFATLYLTLIGCSVFSLFFYSLGAQIISSTMKKYARMVNRITGGCFIGLSTILVLSNN